MSKLRAVFTKDTLKLLVLIVAPVWGAGVYVSETTTGVFETQLEAASAREVEWITLLKDVLACQHANPEGETDE